MFCNEICEWPWNGTLAYIDRQSFLRTVKVCVLKIIFWYFGMSTFLHEENSDSLQIWIQENVYWKLVFSEMSLFGLVFWMVVYAIHAMSWFEAISGRIHFLASVDSAFRCVGYWYWQCNFMLHARWNFYTYIMYSTHILSTKYNRHLKHFIGNVKLPWCCIS